MSLFDKKGITLSANFDYQAQAPLDSRQLVSDITERDRLVTENAAYPGLKVFVLSTKLEYLYDGTTWKSIEEQAVSGLDTKVDKIEGKGLSTNDYTDEDKQALADATQNISDLQTSVGNINKESLGLGNVDNTSDLDKPISTATQAALDTKVDKVEGKGLSTNDYTNEEKQKVADAAAAHVDAYHVPTLNADEGASKIVVGTVTSGKTVVGYIDVPTKASLGLGNVDNTSDLDKPISTATQTALDTKVDKEDGKGLSSNDYTDEEKTKLASIANGAQVNVIEGVKVNGSAVSLTDKVADITVPTKVSELENDANYGTTAAVEAAQAKADSAYELAETKTQVIFANELPASADPNTIVMIME